VVTYCIYYRKKIVIFSDVSVRKSIICWKSSIFYKNFKMVLKKASFKYFLALESAYGSLRIIF
jgi:hypothetical protein